MTLGQDRRGPNGRGFEKAVEDDRDRLAAAVQALFGGATADYLSREAMGLLRGNGGGYVRAVESAVRANPVAAAVTGIGLAWLILGRNRGTEAEEAPAAKARQAASDTAEDWMGTLDELRAAASDRLRRLEEAARGRIDDARGEASETAAHARDYLSDRAELLAELTEGMKKRLAAGLDDLSASARDGIVAAREEAYALRMQAEDAALRGGRKARKMAEDHPMVAAAMTLALGAALQAALRRRRD